MEKFRIISYNSGRYKVQYRRFLIFWKTIQRPENLDSKDFGGDMIFGTKEKAQDWIIKNKNKY